MFTGDILALLIGSTGCGNHEPLADARGSVSSLSFSQAEACATRHYETNVAGGRGFRTYRRACSAATEIEGVLTEGRSRWLADAL